MENNDNFLCVGVCLLVWSVDCFFFFNLVGHGKKEYEYEYVGEGFSFNETNC